MLCIITYPSREMDNKIEHILFVCIFIDCLRRDVIEGTMVSMYKTK